MTNAPSFLLELKLFVVYDNIRDSMGYMIDKVTTQNYCSRFLIITLRMNLFKVSSY